MGWVHAQTVVILPVFAQGLGLPYPGRGKFRPYSLDFRRGHVTKPHGRAIAQGFFRFWLVA
jgi:hypothetical protein